MPRKFASVPDFYHQKLNSWFADSYQSKEELTIVLDGGEDGYGPSFLDEAFGNLVYDFTLEVVRRWLIIDSEGDYEWGEDIENETFPIWEENRRNHAEPVKTEDHNPWYRLSEVSGALEQKVWVPKSNQV